MLCGAVHKPRFHRRN
uniref:Uncharacterized protein n=1 Tax=Anguilla anguilla TaxID=7936 RepID=A0A0E9QK35_ANGAN